MKKFLLLLLLFAGGTPAMAQVQNEWKPFNYPPDMGSGNVPIVNVGLAECYSGGLVTFHSDVNPNGYTTSCAVLYRQKGTSQWFITEAAIRTLSVSGSYQDYDIQINGFYTGQWEFTVAAQNSNGWAQGVLIQEFDFVGNVGIESVSSDSELWVKEGGVIETYSMSGQKVSERKTGSIKSSLPSGIYIEHLVLAGEHKAVRKIIE